MINISALAAAAAHYDAGDPRRVQHFIKVYGYCRLLGLSEGLDTHTQNMLEAAALLHDIGIHEAERRHGSSAGPYQEQEGPAVACPLLSAAGADESEIERICWLIAHHHSCQAGEDTDFRILLEADFLVNADEDRLPRESIASARERLFRTDSGKKLLDDIFSLSHTLYKEYKDRKSADTMFALFAYLSGIIACWSVSTDASSLRP